MTTTKPTKTTIKKKVAATIENLPHNPFAFEVLHLVSKQRTKGNKVKVLQKYRDPSLDAVLIWNFDETCISVLPPGDVPYTGYDEQNSYSGTLSTKISYEVRKMHETDSFSVGAGDNQGHTTIRREYTNFYHFLKGGNDAMNNIRRETMFINILEGLHPLEAEILTLIKDHDLESKYKISKDVVAQAYPDITWGGRS
jgi:hypothetical protein|tara:strand:- start:620 stop:1210 length:591 start_codon:yes stop_codon:yes gene_type:complete